MLPEEEEILIARARAGDTRAFDRLREHYDRRIFAFCVRIVRQDQDAEDAVQETFVRAWKALGNFRGESRFSTWLGHIAQNACIDITRRRREQPSLDDPDNRRLGEQPHPASTPEEIVVGAPQPLTEMVLEEAARARPPWDRLDYLIFGLHFGEGKMYEEIAGLLAVPAGTVRSRVHSHIKPVLKHVERALSAKRHPRRTTDNGKDTV